MSDGLDISRGADSASPSQSLDLQRAVNEAQRRGVAIYSVYAPTASTPSFNSILTSYAQGSLNRLSDETGGKAFFQGTGAPVSFDPYFRDLSMMLTRQIALTLFVYKHRRRLSSHLRHLNYTRKRRTAFSDWLHAITCSRSDG
ncbi:MAG: hypothetical protein WKF84_08715 [Pyrinomonadaceae bacterium]